MRRYRRWPADIAFWFSLGILAIGQAYTRKVDRQFQEARQAASEPIATTRRVFDAPLTRKR